MHRPLYSGFTTALACTRHVHEAQQYCQIPTHQHIEKPCMTLYIYIYIYNSSISPMMKPLAILGYFRLILFSVARSSRRFRLRSLPPHKLSWSSSSSSHSLRLFQNNLLLPLYLTMCARVCSLSQRVPRASRCVRPELPCYVGPGGSVCLASYTTLHACVVRA